jgi:molybdopterin-guanine dinucleotide biosynthesis protein A
MKQSAEKDTADLIGVVLCGGQSSRMGRDKGLIGRDGMVWAARMGGKLAACGMPIVYSVRAEQVAEYSAALPGDMLISDALDIEGPLNGLFSVHRRFPGSDLLVLACDMQDMDEGTIGELIGEYRKGGAEYYVYYEGEFAQPFCAVYTAGGLQREFSTLGEDRSLRSVIGKGVERRLEVRREKAFGNYNSK